MARILLVYSTVDGQTREICRRLAKQLIDSGNAVTLADVAELDPATLGDQDKIVVGASIRYGKYRPKLIQFVRGQADALEALPSAFFTVNLVARKPGRDTPDTNPYVKKLLKETSWRPNEIAVFAGRIDYPRYSWRDRQIIRLIMWLTGGPTDPKTTAEFTDWEKVKAFGDRIGRT